MLKIPIPANVAYNEKEFIDLMNCLIDKDMDELEDWRKRREDLKKNMHKWLGCAYGVQRVVIYIDIANLNSIESVLVKYKRKWIPIKDFPFLLFLKRPVKIKIQQQSLEYVLIHELMHMKYYNCCENEIERMTIEFIMKNIGNLYFQNKLPRFVI